MIDFTGCERLPFKAYNGANGKKIAVLYQGEQYMLKFPPSGANKPTELSYTNSCISEHIASSIFGLLGIPAQKTLLGKFCIGEKEKIVCACRDFTAGGKQFFDFCSIKNTIIDSDSAGNGTELADILETIEKQQFVRPDVLLEHFWNMFVVDALLGNFDRHNGNWGFLYDPHTECSEIAPIYDCGSCLLPQADEAVMTEILNNEDALNARVYRFPTSAIKQHGHKINYFDFLSGCREQELCAAVVRMYGRIHMDEILSFVENISCPTEFQKEFYMKYISARFEKIIHPVYKLTLYDAPKERIIERFDEQTLTM